MIDRLTTTEVMEIFEKAATQAENMQKEVVDAKHAIEQKLSILDAQYEYAMNLSRGLKENEGRVPKKIVLSTVEKVGEYDIYGETVHKKFTKAPRDIFNLKTTRGYLPKDNITSVTVNGEENEAIKNSLRQESIEGRTYNITEYTTDTLTIIIEPNLKAPLGSLKMNMIEICPFLPGSFNIESLELYSKDNLENSSQALPNGIAEVGPRRIFFDDRTDVGKIVMRVKLLYKNSAGKYPFGLRHMYCQEVNTKENSYVIVRTDRSDYIAYINDDIVIKNQNGAGRVSSKDLGIKYYAEYDGNVLRHEIESSNEGDPNFVSLNTMSCFISIPLTLPLVSLTPSVITVSESTIQD
jgi:hypothetical protein